MSFAVPLELTNMPASVEVVNEPPSYITIRVRGNSRALGNIKPGKIKVTLDLKDVKEGTNVYRVSREQVILPRGLTVTKINPTKLIIKTERVIEKKVPVVLDLRGSLEECEVSIDPNVVDVKGVKSQVRRIRVVKTETLDLSNFDLEPGKMAKKSVELIHPGRGVYLDPEKVTVTVKAPQKSGGGP
jgi:YbbR domain-containing protein